MIIGETVTSRLCSSFHICLIRRPLKNSRLRMNIRWVSENASCTSFQSKIFHSLKCLFLSWVYEIMVQCAASSSAFIQLLWNNNMYKFRKCVLSCVPMPARRSWCKPENLIYGCLEASMGLELSWPYVMKVNNPAFGFPPFGRCLHCLPNDLAKFRMAGKEHRGPRNFCRQLSVLLKAYNIPNSHQVCQREFSKWHNPL